MDETKAKVFVNESPKGFEFDGGERIESTGRCRDCPVSRCVELLIVVLTLDSYLSLCRLVLAY